MFRCRQRLRSVDPAFEFLELSSLNQTRQLVTWDMGALQILGADDVLPPDKLSQLFGLGLRHAVSVTKPR
jgi:hypothetical protein